jgi:hypothetical protein
MKYLILLFISLIGIAAHADGGQCSAAVMGYRNAEDASENERNLTLLLKEVVKKQARGVTTAEAWLNEIHRSQAEHPLSIREHSALMLVERMGFLEGYGDGQALAMLRDSLRLSFIHLSGREPRGDEWLQSLPVGVLRAGTPNERVFYRAVVNRIGTGEKLKLFPRTIRSAKRTVRTLQEEITFSQAISVLAGLGAMVVEWKVQGQFKILGAVSGALVGLAQAGLTEYVAHLAIGHATDERIAWLSKNFGPVGAVIEEVRLSHRLHHILVSQDFRVAVLDEEQTAKAENILRAMVSEMILARMKRKNPNLTDTEIVESAEFKETVEKRVAITKAGNFGVDASVSASKRMLMLGMGSYLMNYAAFAVTGNMSFQIAADLTFTFMTVQSIYSHFYMHYFPEYRAAESHNSAQVWFLTTPLGQQARRRHAEHHYDQFVGARNGNIMALAPADHLLDQLTELSIEHLIDLQARGILPEL